MFDAIYYCCMTFLVMLSIIATGVLLIHILTNLVIYAYCIITCQIDKRRSKNEKVKVGDKN